MSRPLPFPFKIGVYLHPDYERRTENAVLEPSTIPLSELYLIDAPESSHTTANNNELANHEELPNHGEITDDEITDDDIYYYGDIANDEETSDDETADNETTDEESDNEDSPIQDSDYSDGICAYMPNQGQASMTSNGSKGIFPFLRLPQELRDRIYRFLLWSDTQVMHHPVLHARRQLLVPLATFSFSYNSKIRYSGLEHTGMRQTSTAICGEINDFFRHSTYIEVHILVKPEKPLPHLLCQHISYMHLVLYPSRPWPPGSLKWLPAMKVLRTVSTMLCRASGPNSDKKDDQAVERLRGGLGELLAYLPSHVKLEWYELELYGISDLPSNCPRSQT